MRRPVASTTSVCPKCRAILQAKTVEVDGKIYLEKSCPKHGDFSILISTESGSYHNLSRFTKPALTPKSFSRKYERDCPDNCGFCTEHEQHLCMPIIEITSKCDFNCPICIARAGRGGHLSIDALGRMLDKLIDREGKIDILNLSGGEPTIHPDFKEIVRLCARRKVGRVSVSTNGRTLLANPDLAKFLRDEKVIVSLQFDGFSDPAYMKMRGMKLAEEKRNIIALLGQLKAPMSLVFTLAKGINDGETGTAVETLLGNGNIVSLMVQPLSFAGMREDTSEFDDAGITMSETIELISEKSKGLIRKTDLLPLPCSHPACFSMTFLLKLKSGGFMPINRFIQMEDYLDIVKNKPILGLDRNGFEKIRKLAYELWCAPAGCFPESRQVLETVKHLIGEAQKGGFDQTSMLSIGESNIKSIFIHHFMDARNFDLSRARKCCNSYPQPDGDQIPACVFNVLRRK